MLKEPPIFRGEQRLHSGGGHPVQRDPAVAPRAAVRGGHAAQQGAVAVEEAHGSLKKAGMLTRDSREVERKKYGKPGARKSYQYSKR